jgi:hypothetical protein
MHGWWLPVVFLSAAIAASALEYIGLFLRVH